MSKRAGTPTSNKETFDTILNNYNFDEKVFWESEKQTYKKINRLVVIDDVIARGKTIYTLLKNLCERNIITNQTIIYGNFIYCIEKRFQELLF